MAIKTYPIAKLDSMISTGWTGCDYIIGQFHCALIILGKMHFLLILENEIFHEIKCYKKTSFMDFMYGRFNLINK